MDLGNFVAVGLVFGQFVSNQRFSVIALILGILISLACYLLAYLMYHVK